MLEDKPGALLAIAQNLKAKKIGLIALWGYGTESGQADVYCIAKDTENFRTFSKSAGMSMWEGIGFLLKGADKTGALAKSLAAVAKVGVNIVAVHAMAASGNYGAVLRVADADIEKTAKALGAK